MSFPILSYHCRRCGYFQYAGFTGSHVYVYPNGGLIPLMHQTGWCSYCDKLQDIEDLSITPRLELLADLQRKITSVQKNKRLFLSNWTYDAREWDDDPEWREKLSIDTIYRWSDQIDQVIKGIELIHKRISPPRCLTCGGTDVESAVCSQSTSRSEPHSDHVLFHPGCGGELGLHAEGDIYINSSKPIREYSAEGEFLGHHKVSNTRSRVVSGSLYGGNLISWIRKQTD